MFFIQLFSKRISIAIFGKLEAILVEQENENVQKVAKENISSRDLGRLISLGIQLFVYIAWKGVIRHIYYTKEYGLEKSG